MENCIKYISLCIVIFLTTIGQLSHAQNSAANDIIIHTDRPYYITGDMLNYKVYLPSEFDDKEKVIRTSFIKNDKSLISQSFMKTGNNSVTSNVINIPTDLPSGMYHLVLSSFHIEMKQELTLAEIFVPVYADLKNDPKIQEENNTSLSEIGTGSNIDVTIDAKNTEKRIGSDISTSITVRDKLGKPQDSELSVTVIDKAQIIQGYKSVHICPTIDEQMIDGLSSEIFISGSLKTAENNKKKFPVVAIYAPEENKFSYLQTDEDGQFSLTIPDFYGSKKVQFINYDSEQIQISIDTPPISENPPRLIVTEDILTQLDWNRKRRKIKQIFEIPLAEIKEKQTTWEIAELEKDQLYEIDKYESFEDIATLFTEVMSPLRLRKLDDGSYKAQVFNRDPTSRGYYNGTPIFIVDGLTTKDATFINELDLNMIKTISIISDLPTLRKSYGPIGQSGVIHIETTLPEVRLPGNELESILTLSGFRSAELMIDPKVNTAEVPNFKSNIYWSTDLRTNENGTLDFQFTHSDDIGEFIIEVVTQSKTGEIATSTASYSVPK